jgi:squalene-hopene/tetraprenyl-beta-curcumene cyclase
MTTCIDIDLPRVRAAYETAKELLLAERVDGHWVGELSTSALSTATAVSALALVAKAEGRGGKAEGSAERGARSAERGQKAEGRRQKEEEDDEPGGLSAGLRPLIDGGVKYLVGHQNDDGGWGDTDKSYSNVATTYLAVAAIHLSGNACGFAEQLRRAEAYIDAKGRIAGLKQRYGVDKTFVVPILTNCALAGLVPWKEVSPLPFELACVPQSWYRFVSMPVVSYAIPALVAIGQARYFHAPPWNPLMRGLRAASVQRSLKVLRQMQPASGGYLEAVPLTSFVVMSLASTGRVDHAVTREGVKFLADSVRPNGSWPIDTNLATWVTTLALNALAGAGEDITQYASLDWLLSCQHRERHPFTGADPGGWGWSDLSGAVPDADDTPGALLALSRYSMSLSDEPEAQTNRACESGLAWLLNLQNRDGGWPTFCRGWSGLPFDRSGTDLTAHAIRAIVSVVGQQAADASRIFEDSTALAIDRGFRFIERNQRPDGSWVPLWFGNQDHPEEENPIYGTAKVLLAYRDVGRTDTLAAQRGFNYLLASQNADGGWGGGASVRNEGRRLGDLVIESTVEETALAVEALLAVPQEERAAAAPARGIAWLCAAVENGRLFDPAPIGFYFAKLWYYERLYPLTFTVSALGRVLRSEHKQ